MSGSIFGRVQHSRAAPIAIPPQVITPATRDSVCVCTCTGVAVTGESLSGQSVTAGSSIEEWTAGNPCDISDLGLGIHGRGIICTSDMVTSLTLASLPAGHCSAGVGARVTRASADDGYFYFFEYNPNRTAAQFFLSGPDPFTTLASSTFPTAVVEGATLELSVIGTSIIASHNGSTMFSITDSSLGDVGIVDADPTQYGFFNAACVSGGPIVVSDFLVTPTC